MRAIDGVILSDTKVQIKGGTVLKVEKHELSMGQRVKVYWDFTENRLRDILPETDTHPIHEVDTSHCRDEEDEAVEYDDLIDSCLGLP